MVVAHIIQNLRSHVTGSSAPAVEATTVCRHFHGQAKVGDDYVSIVVQIPENEVFSLDVSMHDAFRVDIPELQQNAIKGLHDGELPEALLVEPVVEIATTQVVQHQVDSLVTLVSSV